MLTESAINHWRAGEVTFLYLYHKCDTDEEFYDFLKKEKFDSNEIYLIMRDVSGSDDAYNSAVSQKDIGVKVKVSLSGIIEKEVEIELWYNGSELDDIDDDEELYYKIEEDYKDAILDELGIEISWERIKN